MAKYIVHSVEFDAVQKKRGLTREYVEANYDLQPKHDGCNMVVKLFSDGSFEVRSRTNEVVRSMDHVALILQNEQYAKLCEASTGLVYLGEAWTEGLNQSDISGLFRQHNSAPNLGFIVFDVLTQEEFEAGKSNVVYRDRVRRFQIRDIWETDRRVRRVLTIPHGSANLDKMQAELQARGGYDGVIARDPNGTWTAGNGTTGEVIKFKPTESYDLECIGVEEGLGKDAGTVGAYVFRWRGGKQVKARGGNSDDKRLHLEQPGTVVGKIGEIECIGLTSGGLLREPRLKGWRFDKVAADA